jgi:hypothetical protein
VVAVAAAALAAFGAGCGSHPPCTIDVAAVDEARRAAARAEAALEEAEQRRVHVEEALEAEAARAEALAERKAELEAKLAGDAP